MIIRHDGDLLRLRQLPQLFTDARKKTAPDLDPIRITSQINLHCLHA